MTVHRPLDEPVTEAALAAAIEIIHATGARVEMLEDGLQADVYRYEWTELPGPPEIHSTDGFFGEPIASRPRVRMLAGRRESVYLPYAWIHAVEARSWPLWAGVEIQVAGVSDTELEGPLVIRAGDAEEAARLTDAIDCLRRARRLGSAPLAGVSAPPPE
jgi:hypothetical protein